MLSQKDEKAKLESTHLILFYFFTHLILNGIHCIKIMYWNIIIKLRFSSVLIFIFLFFREREKEEEREGWVGRQR